MIKYNLILILRRLRKDKLFSIVNVIGLTIGLTAFLMITLYVKHELSFDKFHADADKMYIVTSKYQDRQWRGNIASDYVKFFEDKVVGLESYSRVSPSYEMVMIQAGDKSLNIENAIRADQNFFEFFSFELINGGASAVLANSGSVVITESLSKKLFGEESPIGKELLIEKGERKYTITGLAKDAPRNSSFNFQLVTFDQNAFRNQFEQTYSLQNVLTYLKLNEGTDLNQVAEQITSARMDPPYAQMSQHNLYAVAPFTEQRLYADYDQTFFDQNDIRFLQLFGGIALVVLLLAVINYINLVTTQSIKRGKEIGLRKVIGANRRQLMAFQFAESIVVVVLSFVLAFALTERLLPTFNELLNKDITIAYFGSEFFLWVVVAGVVIGVLSGLYPALQMHKVKPVHTVKSSVTGTKESSGFRKALVLFQFVVTAILTCCLGVMVHQMEFLKAKDLGFNAEAIISIPLDEDSTQVYQPLKQEFLKVSGVKQASISGFRPGGYAYVTALRKKKKEGEKPEALNGEAIFGDPAFIDIMQMKVLWQKNANSIEDFEKGQVIVNKAMAIDMGILDDPVGKRIYSYSEDDNGSEVVAIVEDFHMKSLKDVIEPITIYPLNDWGIDNILVKLETADLSQTIDKLSERYEEYFGRPFEFDFLDDKIASFYKKEEGQYKLFQVFSTIALSISLMGLIALTVYSLQQRRKEVSIRKVLGASVQGLLFMLNKEYSILVVIAFIIAIPIAYFSMQGWLQEFEYRISLSPLLFAIVFVTFLSLSWLVTLFQSIGVTKENPADVLREE